MDRTGVSLRPVDTDADALAYVERLLTKNDLPTEDVREKAECFSVALDGDERVGVGGVESFPPDGLLRSVVVEPSRRGTGVGAAICDRLEAQAAADGIDALFLLTTTAADFFAARGYDALDREAVPGPIRETAQFTDLCPSTATVMRKRL